MGAHPSAPSGVERAGTRTTLDAVIAADPSGELGAQCAARFGGRLPFLLKVLAAEEALSIQVHPSREQAEAGYLAENERGLAPGDKSRNYVDDWPKPEILCALTQFEVLAGMRTTAGAAALLRALEVSELAPLAAELANATGPAALSRALATILTWPAADRGAFVARGGGRLRADRGARRRIRRRVRRGRAAGGRAPWRPRHCRVPAAEAHRPAAGRGCLPARGRPARLPARDWRGTARQLRQRRAGRAHRQARRRPGAAEAH